ncbi:hypothetical protein ACP70R_031503 [Stipagrostis hirtigluma subsp. patula]
MPPVRRRGRAPCASVAAPYRRGDRRRRAGDRFDVAINGTALPDGALAGVFSRFLDVADVVRCAATCRRWARVVAESARALAHVLPPPGRWLPRLAIGVFHQENDAPTARTRRSSASAAPPRFAPMASAARLVQSRWRPLIGSHDNGLFHNSVPVASRNGRLVLEIQREGHADGLRLCVCNPMSGDAAMLPPLSGPEKPRDYGCAVITGDDLHPRPRSLAHFHVLLLYNRRGFTALRCYSSDAGRWGPEAKSSVRVSGWKLRHVGQAVVRRGVAFWPLDHGALGVRVGATAPEITEMHLLPYDVPHYWPALRLLGVTPEDRLFFVYFGIWRGALEAKLSYFVIDGDDISTGWKEWSSLEEAIPMEQLRMTCEEARDTLKLRWVCEKSGLLFFTLGESSGHSGTFALNLQEKTVEKVADGEGHSWRNFVGYEMDTASYLASIAP